jgi:hypothetical protein
MTRESNRISWLRPILYGLLAEVLAFVAAMLVIAGYATYLGFKARGAPDQALIGRFAAGSAPWIAAVVGILLVLAFARRVARKAGAVGLGLMVGLAAALFDIVAALAFNSRLDIHTAVVVGLLVLSGWLGGRLGYQRAQGQTPV